MVEVICKQCGKKFKTFPSQIKRGGGKFCSVSCGTTYRNLHNNPSKDKKVRGKISKNHADVAGKNNPMYGKTGELAPSYIDGRSKFTGEVYRKIALANFEYKCYLCGECEKKLEVHHIDGNHSNNNVNNLCFLCKKCHKKHAHKLIRDKLGRILTVKTIDVTALKKKGSDIYERLQETCVD